MTPGNVGDAGAARALLAEDLPAGRVDDPSPTDRASGGGDGEDGASGGGGEPLAVYGDAAYGAGELLEVLNAAGVTVRCKVQPAVAPAGRLTKDQFTVDLESGTVRCPAGVTTAIRPAAAGGGVASFGAACARCPLSAQCTGAKNGRTITVGPYEEQLQQARVAQQDPVWRQDYRATRPKVERKIGHLMRRRHGGRRARVHGKDKVGADLSLLAAAVNLARLAVLDVFSTGPGGWVTGTA